MLRRRPTRVDGDLTFPNKRRLLRILIIERWLHSAAAAICDVFKDPLYIMSRILSSLEGESRGAICAGSLEVDYSVVGTTAENGFLHTRPAHPSDQGADEMIFD